jgi:hypothetical protein
MYFLIFLLCIYFTWRWNKVVHKYHVSEGFIIIKEILGYVMEEDISNKEIQKRLRRIKASDFDIISRKFLKQQPFLFVNNMKYSIYTIDIITEQAIKYIDIDININKDIGNFDSSIDFINKGQLIFNCLSPRSFFDYSLEESNINNRYILIPVALNMENKKSGHFSGLIFDREEYKVYFIDPNGITTYFNKPFNTYDSEFLLEKILILYIKEINDLCYNYDIKPYTFVPRKIWNKYQFVINKSYDNSVIESGNCVICTILMMHFLVETNISVDKMIELFNTMSNDEIIQIINGYLCGINKVLPIRTK